MRGLAAELLDGAGVLSREALPEALAVMTAGLGFYHHVLAALQRDPLPRQVLQAVQAALPSTASKAIGGGLIGRWPSVI